jgi:dTDP-4-amino-4,6-dideoxygalactose transaminase
LKVIYDAAHAFGAQYNGRSLVDYGDISTCSFHSTKLFHTIEGGGLVIADDAVAERTDLARRFGHNGDEHLQLGINGKASEFQAAMGLCNLKYLDQIIEARKSKSSLYDSLLPNMRRPKTKAENYLPNYCYYPVILDSEEQLQKITTLLGELNIFPRRYFYPSLNKLPYIEEKQTCAVSEDIASRILCLPLYFDLSDDVIRKICEVINK